MDKGKKTTTWETIKGKSQSALSVINTLNY